VGSAVLLTVTLVVPVAPAASTTSSTGGSATVAAPAGDGVVPAIPEGLPEDPVAPVTEAEDPVAAAVGARSSGERVEVLSLRSQTSRTWVNPDGSWTTEDAAGPVRFEDPATGEWRDVDLTLRAAPDGGVAAAAHPLGVSFAGGSVGEVPASQVSDLVGGEGTSSALVEDPEALAPVTEPSGESVSVAWPGVLPEPALLGPTATYPGVTPGVDLVMEAQSTGWESFFVVAEPPAPGVELSWTLPLELTGVTARAEDDGSVSFVATDGGNAGEVVSSMPPAVAWDSQRDERADEPTNLGPVDLLVVPLTTGGQALQVVPDPAWMASAVFPITVDPSYASGSATATSDTTVQSGSPDTPQGSFSELKIGTYDGGGSVARSYLTFPNSAFSGKRILSASVELFAHHSYSCSARNWKMSAASAADEATTTWNNAPAIHNTYVTTSSQTRGYSTACDDGWVSIDATSLVQHWASVPATTVVALALLAESETDSYGWKKFQSRETATPPRITYTYSRPPVVEPWLAVEGRGYDGSVWAANRRFEVRARATDADGNQYRNRFDFFSATSFTAPLQSCTAPLVASGADGACRPTSNTPDNAVSRIRIQATDETGVASAVVPGGGGWFGVHVASTAPAVPTVACPAANGSWTATVPGSPLACTVTAALPNTAMNAAGYLRYQVDGGPVTTVKIGQSSVAAENQASLTVPNTPGGHRLTAWAESRSGVLSTPAIYTFGFGAFTVSDPAPAAAGDAYAPRRVGDVVDIGAAGPTLVSGVTPTASVRWRVAGTSAWNAAPGGAADLAATQGSSGVQVSGTVDVSMFATDATRGPLDPHVPVVLDVDVCVTAQTLTACSFDPAAPTRVLRVAEDIGPGADTAAGSVSLWTGELTASATDVTLPDPVAGVSVSRTHTSLGSAPGAAAPVFGPGWTSDIDAGGVSGATLTDTTTVDGTLSVVDSWGSALTFVPATGAVVRTGTTFATSWEPADDATRESGATLALAATGSGPEVSVSEPDGTTTVFTALDAVGTGPVEFGVARVDSAELGQSRYVYDAADRVVRVLGSVPDGVTCSSTGTLVQGCRALDITYNAQGRVSQITATMWDPAAGSGSGAMVTVTVASYGYDGDGRLTSVTDVQTGLTTAYTYSGPVSSPRLASVTPPGLKAVRVDYASDGRVARLRRDDPTGTGSTTLTSVVYGVPVSGTGLPDLSASAVGAWQQAQPATWAAAVFDADRPLAGTDVTPAAVTSSEHWKDAVIQATDATGQVVNTAEYGAGAWLVSATDHTATGQVARELDAEATATARDRAQSSPGQSADDLATLYRYHSTDLTAPDGTVVISAESLVTDVYGPARWATRADGTTAWVRPHTATTYDQGAPVRADGSTHHGLATTETVVAAPGGAPATGEADLEVVTRTFTSYGATAGEWERGQPTSTTTDLDLSGAVTGADITVTTAYDADGRVVEERQPGATGADAGTTRHAYYTVGAHPTDATCGNRPAWAGLPCLRAPAGAPSSGPTMPRTRVTYDRWLNPAEVLTENLVTGTTRTVVRSYDASGRATLTRTTLTGLSGSPDVPGQAVTYSASTGLPATLQATTSSGATTGGTAEFTYDAWGRRTRYKDVPGNQTSTAYDGNSRVTAHGGLTYVYGGTDALGREERRDVVTRIGNPQMGDVTGAYDRRGQLVEERQPGQVTRRTVYDGAGVLTGLTYLGPQFGTSGSVPWMAWSQAADVLGRVVSEWTPAGSAVEADPGGGTGLAVGYHRRYSYDAAGRLVGSVDRATTGTGQGGVTPSGSTSTSGSALTCTHTGYVFDGRGRRTSLTRTPGDGTGACPVSPGPGAPGAVTRSWAYDSADRLTTSGGGADAYVYDSLGRATTIPSVDAPYSAGGSMAVSYYAGDQVASVTQGAGDDRVHTSYTLDVAGRRVSETVEAYSYPAGGVRYPYSTTTWHSYTDPAGDNPFVSWNASETFYHYPGLSAGLLSVFRFDDGSSRTQYLTNPHGDVVAEVQYSLGGPAYLGSPFAGYGDYGETPIPQYGRGNPARAGWHGSDHRLTTGHGLTLMGARLYNPVTGAFTTPDPIPGGNTTAYAYPQDPINGDDITGLFYYSYTYRIGPTGRTAEAVFYKLRRNFNLFPFSGCGKFLGSGERCNLQVPGWSTIGRSAPVVVTSIWNTGWRFTVQKGHFAPKGSTVEFNLWKNRYGILWITITGRGPDRGWATGNAANRAIERWVASYYWGVFRENLSAALRARVI
jgi:RHS repeat-associated protein